MPLQRPFFATFRVYYEDTDAGGVMYHARYLNFFERARTEWLRQVGIDQSRLAAEHDMVFAIRQAQVTFYKPARLDDCLQVSCQLKGVTAASMTFEQQMHSQEGRMLAAARVTAACVRASDFHPLAWRKTAVADIFAGIMASVDPPG